mgnify:CR=1 FL=1
MFRLFATPRLRFTFPHSTAARPPCWPRIVSQESLKTGRVRQLKQLPVKPSGELASEKRAPDRPRHPPLV